MITGITLALKENNQNIETLKTKVTISATIAWNNGSYDGIGCPLRLKLDGVEVDYVAKVPFNKGGANSGSEVFYTYTTDVEHNANGDKTLSCELIYETARQGGTRTVSASWPLTQIPRASTIAATAADIGSVSMISINRRNDAFSHSIAYQFGDLTGYIQDADGNVGTAPVQLSATSIAFPVPESFYEQIPDAISGECQLTCTTGSGEKQIGEEKTCTFRATANAEQCRPTVNGYVYDINEATVALTNDQDVLVQGKSLAQCDMVVETKHGATIQSRMIGGVLVDENQRTIEGVQLQEITFLVTDSRGYTAEYTAKPTCIPYVPLTCNPAAKRVDPTSDQVILTVKGKYYDGAFNSGNPDAVTNHLTIRYSVVTENGMIDGTFPEEAFRFSDSGYSAAVELEGFDYRNSYAINITAEDAIERINTTAKLQKGIPVFDWGESDFQFNVPVCFFKDENGDGIPILDYVTEEGTTDEGWHYRKWKSRKIELWKSVDFSTRMEWINDGGEGDYIGRYSTTDVSGGSHGFYLGNYVEIATVTGGKGCWLASVNADHLPTETDTYRLYSYENNNQVSVVINFYIFANDYES